MSFKSFISDVVYLIATMVIAWLSILGIIKAIELYAK